MKKLKEISIEEGIKTKINTRVGFLLKEQRALRGWSVRTVARRLKIKRANIEKWENAKASPPCDVFFKLVSFYGKYSLRSAMELDLQFQLEKYQRLVEQQKAFEKSEQKKPAVIWAEHRYEKAVA